MSTPRNPLYDTFRRGTTQIWYMRPEFFRTGISEEKEPDPSFLSRTHRLVGSIDATDLETIFVKMQGENWSPNGEARQWLQHVGLKHTSLSIGDVVRFANGETYVCAAVGWERIECTCSKNHDDTSSAIRPSPGPNGDTDADTAGRNGLK